MNTNKLLVAVVVLQGLTLAGQWLGSPTVVAPAQAQIPDAGNQRIQIIDLLKSLNAKMDTLNDFLQSGQLQVRSANPDQSRKGDGGQR